MSKPLNINNITDPFYGVSYEKDMNPEDRIGSVTAWAVGFISGLWDWTKLPNAPKKYADNKIEYQQTLVSYNSCTIHGAIGCASDLTGIRLTTEEITEIWNAALKKGASNETGWSISEAFYLVADWFAVNKGINLKCWQVDQCSPYATRVAEKGYSLSVGYRGNANYTKDKNDGVLDEENLVGKYTFGHCVRRYMENMVNHIVDNYTRSAPCNNYIVKSMLKLVNNKVFFNNAYFYTIINTK